MQGGIASATPRRRSEIRVVVAGDRSTGKSSLVAAVATGSLPHTIPPVFPPASLLIDKSHDRVPISIIDTSASLEKRSWLIDELKKADVVILTYACDQPLTFSRLSSFWLEELRRLKLNVPVVVAGCKVDLRDENCEDSLEIAAPLMKQYGEIEICVECSALTFTQVTDVFYYAQRAVIHPTSPLFDHERKTLKPRCIRALKRIFVTFDEDMDAALNDNEINNFQVSCFSTSLQLTDIDSLKKLVLEKQPAGVNDVGLTLDGFLFLFSLFIARGRPDSAWAVLRNFGYNDDVSLRHDLLPLPSLHGPDQSIELSSEAVKFLRSVFRSFTNDNSGLNQAAIDAIFSTAPVSPFSEAPYTDAAERNSAGNLTLNGFLSLWSMMTLLNPQESLANLVYLRYPGNLDTALVATRRRTQDRKMKFTERNTFLCLLFGPVNAGKSTLLNSFLQRSFTENHNALYAVKAVDQLGGNTKTLVLREVPDDEAIEILAKKDSLAACDVAVFAYDCSDKQSWKQTSDMLMTVARLGEESGYVVPCLVVATKDDLHSHPSILHSSTKACMELGIDVSIPVSAKLGELNNLFSRVIRAALNPHLWIPQTDASRRKRHWTKIVGNSLVFMCGVVFAAVGVAAFRTCSTRKNS